MKEPMKCEYASIAPLLDDIITTPDPTVQVVTEQELDPSPLVEVPDPDTDATEPFLIRQGDSNRERFVRKFPKEKLLTFLRDLGKINGDEDWHGLGPSYIRRILANPVQFCEAVNS